LLITPSQPFILRLLFCSFTFFERATPVAQERDPTRHTGGHADTPIPLCFSSELEYFCEKFVGPKPVGVAMYHGRYHQFISPSSRNQVIESLLSDGRAAGEIDALRSPG